MLAAFIFAALVSGTPYGSSSDIAACIRNPRCEQTFIVVHRAGAGRGENSVSGVAYWVRHGAPIIEIDLRASKDGVIYALHDGDLRRTTSLRGKIGDFNSSDIDAGRLKNGERIPRLEDIYAVSRGRAVLDLDFKTNAVERVAEWIAERGSFDDVIFFAKGAEQIASASLAKKKYPRMMVMIRARSFGEIKSKTTLYGRVPEIIHLGSWNKKLYADAVRGLGGKVFVDILGWERAPRPLRQIILRQILRKKPDFIQTDHPERFPGLARRPDADSFQR